MKVMYYINSTLVMISHNGCSISAIHIINFASNSENVGMGKFPIIGGSADGNVKGV